MLVCDALLVALHEDAEVELLTLPEVAEALGVHRATVNDMVLSRRLRARRRRGYWYVARDDLEAFAATYVRPPNAPRRRTRTLVSDGGWRLLALLVEWNEATVAELDRASISTKGTSGSNSGCSRARVSFIGRTMVAGSRRTPAVSQRPRSQRGITDGSDGRVIAAAGSAIVTGTRAGTGGCWAGRRRLRSSGTSVRSPTSPR